MVWEDQPQPFTEHLAELRSRLIRSILAVAAGFVLAWVYREPVLDAFVAPVRDALAQRGIYRLMAIEVTEGIFVYLKAALLAGAFGAAPVVIYQLWAFVAPGLLPRERRMVVPFALFTTLFFAAGAAFAYYVLLPFVVGFLADMVMVGGSIDLHVTLSSAFDFTFMSLGVFGLIFELPVVMFVVSLLGVANHRTFIKYGRYFIVLAFVVGAVLTPPDPVSQIMLAVPMLFLYALGVAAAWLASPGGKARRRRVSARTWGLAFGAMAVVVAGLAAAVVALRPPRPLAALAPAGADTVIGLRLGQLPGPPSAWIGALQRCWASPSHRTAGDEVPLGPLETSSKGEGLIVVEGGEVAVAWRPPKGSKVDAPLPNGAEHTGRAAWWGEGAAIEELATCARHGGESCAWHEDAMRTALQALGRAGAVWVAWLRPGAAPPDWLAAPLPAQQVREVGLALAPQPKGGEVAVILRARFDAQADALAWRARVEAARDAAATAELVVGDRAASPEVRSAIESLVGAVRALRAALDTGLAPAGGQRKALAEADAAIERAQATLASLGKGRQSRPPASLRAVWLDPSRAVSATVHGETVVLRMEVKPGVLLRALRATGAVASGREHAHGNG